MKTENILLVDDNDLLMLPYRTMLEHEGYGVLTAGNGVEALNVLERNEVRLVVSDMNMPVMGGRDLLDRVKERYRDTRVIIYSGEGCDVNDLKLRGALDFIVKPVTPRRLVGTVNRVLFDEQRASCRFDVRLPVKIERCLEGYTRNISSDGMLVETPEPLAEAGELSFTVCNPSVFGCFSVTGRVLSSRMVDNDHHAAVHFLQNMGRDLAACMQREISAGYA